MAQFDVFKAPSGGIYPLLVDVQADLLARLDSRIVVPLAVRRKLAAPPIARLHPIVTIGGTEYVALFHHLAAFPRSALGKAVDSLAHRRAELIAALDLLLTGS